MPITANGIRASVINIISLILIVIPIVTQDN